MLLCCKTVNGKFIRFAKKKRNKQGCFGANKVTGLCGVFCEHYTILLFAMQNIIRLVWLFYNTQPVCLLFFVLFLFCKRSKRSCLCLLGTPGFI